MQGKASPLVRAKAEVFLGIKDAPVPFFLKPVTNGKSISTNLDRGH